MSDQPALRDVDRVLTVFQQYGDQRLNRGELSRHAALPADRLDAAIAAAVALGQLVAGGKTWRRPVVGDSLPTVGQAVAVARAMAGLSQAKAAERAGMSQPAWSRLEADGESSEVGTLRRAARAMGCRPCHILPG